MFRNRWPAWIGISGRHQRNTHHTDRKKQTTQYAYDALGRRNLVTYADGYGIAAYYDAGNRLIELNDSASGMLGFGWTGLDDLAWTKSPQGNVLYTYDAIGRRSSMAAGSQPAVDYAWDAADRLIALSQGASKVSFSYDAANRRSQLILPNGMAETYSYDKANEITAIAYAYANGKPMGNLTYTYDADGRRTGQGGSFVSDVLPTATSKDGTFDLNDRQTSFNGTNLQYDANGNLISDGKNTYVWNARNQLVQIKQGTSVLDSFGYDALGRRWYKIIDGAAPVTYLYDGANPVQETQDKVPSPILEGPGIDEYFARPDGGGEAYYLTDAQGSTLALAAPNGALIQQYRYGPYGQANANNPGITNPYQYTGRENDGDGLYYYRARYYSPSMKRFISEDPMGFGGGQDNFYAYSYNSPLVFKDQTGKDPVLALVGGALGYAWGVTNGYLAGDRGEQLWLTDGGAGALTGGLAGLTDGLSLAEGVAARSGISMAVEAYREASNGVTNGCVQFSAMDIGIAGLSSAFGDLVSESNASRIADDFSDSLHWSPDSSPLRKTIVGGSAGGAMQSPFSALEGQKEGSQ